MDLQCEIAETDHTYKHYESVGRASVPCAGHEAFEEDLLKSLAMDLQLDCSSWCVYDYYSYAVLAWKWDNGNKCWDLKTWGSCHWDYTNNVNNTEWEDAKEKISIACTQSPTQSPTSCMPFYTWDNDRSEELCNDYGVTDKSYGVSVCSDANSVGKQQQLDDSLANNFFTLCTSWCVYDYDTLLNNVRTGSSDHGGFIWKSADTCWQWVEAWTCFGTSLWEYDEIMAFAGGLCAAQ